MCCFFFFLFPTRMLCIKKITSVLETDIFTSIHKCSSYNTINSFPHMIPSHPHSIQRKSKALHRKSLVMQVYGSWFQSMKKNVVWSKEKGHRTKGCIHWEVRQIDTGISFCKARILPPRMGQLRTNPHCSVAHTWGPALPHGTPGKASPLWTRDLTYRTKAWDHQATYSSSNKDSHSVGISESHPPLDNRYSCPTLSLTCPHKHPQQSRN